MCSGVKCCCCWSVLFVVDGRRAAAGNLEFEKCQNLPTSHVILGLALCHQEFAFAPAIPTTSRRE